MVQLEGLITWLIKYFLDSNFISSSLFLYNVLNCEKLSVPSLVVTLAKKQ